MDSPQKEQVMQKAFSLHDIIMWVNGVYLTRGFIVLYALYCITDTKHFTVKHIEILWKCMFVLKNVH